MTPITAPQFKAVRISLGITQIKLASWLGVTPEHVSRWEHARRTIPMTVQIIMHFLREDHAGNRDVVSQWIYEITQRNPERTVT